MRQLALFTLLLVFSVPVMAQTAITKEQANSYYAKCISKEDPRLRKETQAMLCSCTSVKMMEAMSVEDVQIMGANTEESRSKVNKMLLDVYVPCINYPVIDMIEAECLTDKKLDEFNDRFERNDLCRCMAERTGDWFVVNGRKLMEEIIAKEPRIYDPITPVMDHPSFKSASYNNMLACTMK